VWIAAVDKQLLIVNSSTGLSLLLATLIYRLAVKQKISFRYLVGWLSICALGIFSRIFIPMVEPLSIFLRVTPSALLAMVGISFLLLICVQLTISISGMQQQIRRLTEEIALLGTQSPNQFDENQEEQK
jgi:hypothetical protein